MIIDTSQGKVEVIGDSKEFKSSIDPKNLEFITTLLSSNLYSNPEESFIREIVSNAWDSHVEAGNTDTPVIIKFSDSCGNKSVTIRDYGTGLSPERFAEVYRNIGSSTKRESNDYIGCFGIGHLSPFACSNSVFITSYYNGIAYYYVGTKINNSITYHQLNELPTEEKNGVEITIKNIKDIAPYENALEYIIFFPNIYVTGSRNERNINETKLKRCNNFAVASIAIRNKILLGNVLYPLDKHLFNYDIKSFLDKIELTGIVIKFDVGDLNITPNRENIIYNSDTIKKIESKILDAKKELYGLINEKIKGEYTNLNLYYNHMSSYIRYDPINDSIDVDDYKPKLYIRITELEGTTITYKGKDLTDCLGTISWMLSYNIPNFKCFLYDDKFYVKSMPWNKSKNNTMKADKILILNKEARLTPTVKAFLKEYYTNYSIATYFSAEEFIGVIKLYRNMSENEIYIANEVYNSFIERTEYLDLTTDSNFKVFKEAYSNLNKGKLKIDIGEVILHRVHSSYKEKLVFNNMQNAITHIRAQKTGIVLVNMNIDTTNLYWLARSRGYIIYKAKKEVIERINSLNLSCIIDIKWLTEENPLLSKIKSIREYYPVNISQLDYNILQRNLNETELKELREIRILWGIYDSGGYNKIIENQSIPYDPYIKYVCEKFSDYIKKQKLILGLFGFSITDNNDLITAALIKSKAYKIKFSTYNHYKHNLLIQLLCKK